MKHILFVLCAVFCNSTLVMGNPYTSHIPKYPVTPVEIQILKNGDYYSASKVIGRMQILFKEQGLSAVREAIPAMNAILAKLQTLESDNHSTLEGELVSFLGQIGDPSSLSVLLKAILRDNGNASIGLVKMRSAVDSVITYLQVNQGRIRSKAAHCLIRMYQRNPSIFTKAHKNLIRTKLVENLGRYEYKGSACLALAFFGDSTTVPLLTEIATTDTLQAFPNEYANRRYAQYAIDKIRQR